MTTDEQTRKTAAIVVAHPDDETLWAGGLLLLHPEWNCRIITLCRGSDYDRALRFYRVLSRYCAAGEMGDLDDGPAQMPLNPKMVEATILDLLDRQDFDILVTHGPRGEYSTHRRHMEVSDAVTRLWCTGRLRAEQLHLFAYTDDHRAHLPLACADADLHVPLPADIWTEKHRIIRDLYGFADDSWEARTTPVAEAFHRFTDPVALTGWLRAQEEAR